MAKQELCTGTFTVAEWVVSADATQGTHTTITAALADASSGDTIFVRDGTYTEDLTLKAGVSLAAFSADALTPTVTIVGKCSFSVAGTTSLSGLRLQTNGDFLLEVTGSAASIVNLKDCYLECSNNTGINFTSSSGSANIVLSDSVYSLSGAVALFSSTSPGVIKLVQVLNIVGSSTTASTASAGAIDIYSSIIGEPLTTSGTASIFLKTSNVGTGSGVVALTVGGSGGGLAERSVFASGGAFAAVSISSLYSLVDCIISASNTPSIDGTGSLNYGAITFIGSSSSLGGSLTLIKYDTKPHAGSDTTSGGANANRGTAAFNSTQFTVSDGFVSLSGGTAFTWTNIGASQALVSNNGYICSSGGALSLSLPATSSVGDIIEIALDGATSWSITQGAGQRIRVASLQTTLGAGGSVTSTAQGDTIRIVCRTANTLWTALDFVGSLTVV